MADIYTSLYALLKTYEPALTPKIDEEGRYELYSMHPVTLSGRTLPELFFAGIGRRSGYTGLYFFPVYTHPKEFTQVPPELKKCLKGKSCFHIKTLDGAMLPAITKMLEDGYAFYKRNKLL